MLRGFSQEYKFHEKEMCNCDKRSVIPTLDHRSGCKFNEVMLNPRVAYHNLKIIQDCEKETHQKFESLGVEMTKMQTDIDEIKSMIGDFLALFRAAGNQPTQSPTLN